MSLRTRIASGVFAGLAVLFAVFGALAVTTISRSTDYALDERLRLAQISAESIDEAVALAAHQLERMAASVATRPTTDEQRRRANELNTVLGGFGRMVGLGPEGDVLWTFPELSSDADWQFTSDPEVRAALDGSETRVVGPPANGTVTDDLIALVITPLPGGAAPGFLAAEIHAMRPDLNLLPLPDPGGSVEYEIVDARGYIIARSAIAVDREPDEHIEILVPLIEGRRSGTTVHQVGNGEDHVVAFHPFQELSGGVVVEQTQDDALVIPRDVQRTMLVFGIGALLAAVLAAWLHASSVVRPIRRLTSDAARMASGDLDSAITIARDDEIGELARRFDDMRLRLKDSRDESARWAEQLERRVEARTREVDERNRELDTLNRIRRQLLARTISAQEEERMRLARDLHDDSAQTLTAVLLTLQAAEDALTADPAAAKLTLRKTRAQLEMALQEVRKAIFDLRPSALDDLGLASAIRTYMEGRLRPLGITSSLATSGDEQGAAGPASTAIFRIVQEAISNVAQHSGATNARVSLDFTATELLATVVDDGGGFDPASLHEPQESGRGLGLLGMRERAALFGGDVEIDSHTGAGTTVHVRMPLG